MKTILMVKLYRELNYKKNDNMQNTYFSSKSNFIIKESLTLIKEV